MSHLSHDYRPPKPSYLTKHIVFPFYDFIVQYYPYAWTPNGITLFGIASTTLASLLLLTAIPASTNFSPMPPGVSRSEYFLSPLSPIRGPNGTSTVLGTNPSRPLALSVMDPKVPVAPAWLLFVAGVLNLVYCIADNTDGRQARRTKRSTFIGEYLDHGLDCVTSLMSTFALAVALGVSASLAGVCVAVVALSTVISHTINHERGIMIWGNELVTVDEAMIAFGVGLWIPAFFPGCTTAVLPAAIHGGYLPAGTRYVDVVFVLFVLSQVQFVYSMWKIHRGVWSRLPTLFMLANIVWALSLIPHTSYTSGALSKEFAAAAGKGGCCCSWKWVVSVLEANLSYPAMWAITLACTSSIICHIPIIAKCAGLKRAELGPLGLVLIIWTVTCANPVVGLILAVVSHVTQVLFNVHFVQVTKAAARP